MNIAIFTNNYLPNPYGVSTSVEGFRVALEKMGHTVFIFAPEWGGVCMQDSERIFRYPAIKVPTKVDFSLVIPHSARMDAILRDLNVDVIHAQHPNLLGTVAQKWARRKGVPLIFTWHSLYDRYAHYTPIIPDHVVGKWAMHNAASFAQESDHVIVPTQSIIAVMRDAGVHHDRVSIVPSGVDGDLFADRDGKKIREAYNIKDAQILFTTVSRMTEEKNVIFLMRNMARVLCDNPQTHFLCCGKGDHIGEMKEICTRFGVENRVIFPGKIDRAEVKNYLDAGDIFVYASTSETQGTIVTENMFCGKPIVAVGKNGVGDLVISGKNGLVTEEDDILFVEGVQKMIDDVQLREQCGINAQRIAHEKYTNTACTQKLLSVYEKVIRAYHDKTGA